MIKLHGINYSNYYNIVKTVLLEKEIEFEEVYVRPSQEPDYLEKSPMGKVPCLETDQGFLTETTVILEYLEELGVGPSFYPTDVFERAKVRELIAYIELYLELPGRRLYGEVFFGRPGSEAERAAVKPQLEKGFKALARLARFNPYLAGDSISYADLYFRFALSPVLLVCKKALDWDAYRQVPDVKELIELVDERASVKSVLADQAAESVT